MILLVAAAAWMLALTLVAGLCVAARRGDRAEFEDLARARAAAYAPAPGRPARAAAQPQLQRAA